MGNDYIRLRAHHLIALADVYYESLKSRLGKYAYYPVMRFFSAIADTYRIGSFGLRFTMKEFEIFHKVMNNKASVEIIDTLDDMCLAHCKNRAEKCTAITSKCDRDFMKRNKLEFAGGKAYSGKEIADFVKKNYKDLAIDAIADDIRGVKCK